MINLQTVVINDTRFAVEERNGNISFNLTQMAKPFGDHKKPSKWLRHNPAKEYLEELSKGLKSPLADLVEVRKGGMPELAGTWANDCRIAMRFAQWLDPKFAVAVDEIVIKLLTKQAIVLEPKRGVMPIFIDGKRWYCYIEVMKALGGSTLSSATSRKRKHPHHFTKIYGRNFITEHYFDLLIGYYDWRNSAKEKVNLQLPINFGGQA